jgi:hypothetical protein
MDLIEAIAGGAFGYWAAGKALDAVTAWCERVMAEAEAEAARHEEPDAR